MSRSNPSAYVPNPVGGTVEWSAKHGKPVWYDKEKKESVLLDLPFRFAECDAFNTVTGFYKKYKTGIHGNEVKDLRSEELQAFIFVKIGDSIERQVLAEGLWESVKPTVSPLGGKFGKNLYVVSDGDQGPFKNGELIRFALSGSAMGEYFEKGFDGTQSGTVINRVEQRELDGKPYFVPVFEQETISDELDAIAIKADKEIQRWYNQDSEASESGLTPEPEDSEVHREEDDDDVPF